MFDDDGGGLYALEDTGLNRLLGSADDDQLFGGTGIDFLYGNGGSDSLFRADGTPFSSLDDGLAGDEWKEYAQATDAVWYVSATNAADRINVDFVTEPGLLADHHLITRLTENNGVFSFAAQVRLDFDALDGDGNPLWDAEDVVFDANARLRALDVLGGDALDEEARAAALDDVEMATTNLVNGLLPGEGDFLAIIIDGLDGNDEITVGPTVQKTVWIDAGAGDDTVVIEGGSAILIDAAETGAPTGGLRGRNDLASQAYGLDVPEQGLLVDNLTIDNPLDIDWYSFVMPTFGAAPGVKELHLTSNSPADDFSVEIYDASDLSTIITSGSGLQVATVDLTALTSGTEYRVAISNNQTPTIYGLEFNFAGTPATIDLGLRRDSIRRDVILGGEGDDILQGGAGEDWVFGQAGNDVLTGGADRQASDLLFGGPGDDTFQIIPDALPTLGNEPNSVFAAGTGTFIPTYSDLFAGGDGVDRTLYLGGDFDRRGLPVSDFAMMRYNAGLARYEFSALVWDIGDQAFQADGNNYVQHYAFYQGRDLEQNQVILGAGDDVFHADPSYVLPYVDGSPGSDEWGIAIGDYQQGGTNTQLIIQGGAGHDQLFGGARDDSVDGGPGDDLLMGGSGNDQIDGVGGTDTIYGNYDGTFAGIVKPDGIAGTVPAGLFPSEAFEYELAAPFFFQDVGGRPGVDLSADGEASDAFVLEGNLVGEQLSQLTPIGDFDGDGFGDFMATGQEFSYIFLRPLPLDDVHSVSQRAEIVVDHSVFGVPGDKFADLNADGMADLLFTRHDSSGETGRTVLAAVLGGTPGQRQWNTTQYDAFVSAGRLHEVEISDLVISPDDVTVMALEFDGAGTDLFVSASSGEATVKATALNDDPDNDPMTQNFDPWSIVGQFPTFPNEQVLRRANTVFMNQLHFANGGFGGLARTTGETFEVLEHTTRPDLLTVAGDSLYFYERSSATLSVDKIRRVGPDGSISNVTDLQAQGTYAAPVEMIAVGSKVYGISGVELGQSGNSGVFEILPDGSVTTWSVSGNIPATTPMVYHNHDGNTPAVYFYVSTGVGFLYELQRLNLSNRNVETLGNASQLSLSSNAGLVSAGEYLYFSSHTAVDGVDLQGQELHRYDVSSQTVELVVDLTPPNPLDPGAVVSSTPRNLNTFEDEIYFTAFTGEHGRQLWKHRPSDNTTVMVTNFQRADGNPGFERYTSFTELDGYLYFAASGVYRTDGTAVERVDTEFEVLNPSSADLDYPHLLGSGTDSLWVDFQEPALPPTRIDIADSVGLVFEGSDVADGTAVVHEDAITKFTLPPTTPQATQSSTFDAFGANLAIDGDLTNFTHTALFEQDPEWQMVMDEIAIESIVLHNRDNCCSDRLRDITVEIYADEVTIGDGATPIFTSPLLNPADVLAAPDTITIDLVQLAGAPVIGRTVRVRRTSDGAGTLADDNILSLAEVQVFGKFTEAQLTATVGRFRGADTEDIVFTDAMTDRVYLVHNPSNGEQRLNDAGTAHATTFGPDPIVTNVGDVNVDGLDDLAIAAEGRLEIYLGNTTDSQILASSPFLTFDAGDPTALLQATGGNFDDDPGNELAIGMQLGAVEEVHLLLNPSAQTYLAGDAVISAESTGSGFGQTFPHQPNLDFDQDGRDELIVGAAHQAAPSDPARLNAGGIYVMPGLIGTAMIPDAVVELSNISVPGLGAFVTDRGTGKPTEFDNDGLPFVTLNGESWFRFSTLGDGVSGNYFIVDSDVDLLLDLIFDQGRVLLASRPAISLLGRQAGTYYLRVHHPSMASSEFRLLVDAPIRGQSHQNTDTPDRDLLRGGDGDDTIVGNGDLDAISGGSGADVMTAETIELRDLDAADPAITVAASGDLIANTIPTNFDSVIAIPDTELRSSIAAALGRPANLPLAAMEFRASELASITELTTNAVSLVNIEYLTNVRSLVLHQDVSSSDFARLAPQNGLGMPWLESLDVRATFFGNDAMNRQTLAALPRLRDLIVDVFYVGAEQVAVPIGAATNIPLPSNSGWTVTAPDGSEISGSGSAIVFVPDQAGIHTADSNFTDEFPIAVYNDAPVFDIEPTEVAGVNEGDTLTDAEIIEAAFGPGTIASDVNGQALATRVEVIDPSGRVHTLASTSLQFDGDDDRVALSSGVLDGATDLTTAFWIKTTKTGVTTVVSAANETVADAYRVAFVSDTEMRVAVQGNVYDWTVPSIADNQWQHVAITRDTLAGQLEAFLNGVSLGSLAESGAPLMVSVDGLFLGQNQNSLGSFSPGEALDGGFDDLIVLNRALSAAEIQELMTGAVDPSRNDVLGYWKFNAGSGEVLRDDANGFDAAIESGAMVSPVWSSDSALVEDSFTFADQGSYRVVFTVTDTEGATAVRTTDVNVMNLNPVVDLSVGATEVTIDVGQTLTLSGAGSTDAGIHDQLSYAWVVTTSTGQEIFGGNEPEFTLSPEFPGRYDVELTVADRDDGEAVASVSVDVNPVAVISTLSSPLPLEGDTVRLTAGDAPLAAVGATRTYDWEVVELGYTLTKTGDPTFDFIPANDGIYTVRLTIRDEIGSVTYTSNTLESTVTVGNADPELTLTAPQLVDEGNFDLQIAIADAGAGDTYDLTIEWAPGDTQQILGFTGGTVSHSYLEAGDYTITVDAVDVSDATSAAMQASLEVTVVNVAPVAVIDHSFNGDPQDGVAVDLTGNFTDLGADTHTKSWQLTTPSDVVLGSPMFPAGIAENATGVASAYFAGRPDGFVNTDDQLVGAAGLGNGSVTYELGEQFLLDTPGVDFNVYEYDVADGLDLDEFDKLDVEVSADGTNFVLLAASSNPYVPIPGDEAHAGGSFARSYDLSGSGLTEVTHIRLTGTDLSAPGGTSGFDLDGIGIHPFVFDGSWSFVPSESGTYSAELTVTDNEGGVDVTSVDFEIVNLDPVIENFQQTDVAGDKFTFSGQVTDFRGDELRAYVDYGDGTVAAAALNLQSVAGGISSYSLTAQHVYVGAGQYDVTLTVIDEDGATAVYPVSVQVPISGDFDNDGDLDGADIDLLQANIATGPADPTRFDLNGDGDVDVDDRDLWLALAGAANLPSGNPYLLGDANLDGVVDGQDFIVWNTSKFTANSDWTAGDFNADGIVDGMDFIDWNNNKFTSADRPADDDERQPLRRFESAVDALFAGVN
ncbi:MAG: PKD domain-containing protein [Planctomycetota bacterium]